MQIKHGQLHQIVDRPLAKILHRIHVDRSRRPFADQQPLEDGNPERETDDETRRKRDRQQREHPPANVEFNQVRVEEKGDDGRTRGEQNHNADRPIADRLAETKEKLRTEDGQR